MTTTSARCGDCVVGLAIVGKTDSDVVNNQLWVFEIAYDGTFDGSNEAGKMTDMEVVRGRKGYVRVQQDGDNRIVVGFKYFDMGKAYVVLLDSAGRYNPKNQASDLYGKLRRGLKARIWTQSGNAATPEYLFTGYISDIKHTPGRPGSTRFDMVDSLKKLADASVSVALQTSVTSNSAIGLILDKLNWPTDERNIESTSDTIPYWWTQGRRALTELRDLADAEIGKIFVNATGQLCFYSRNHAASNKISVAEKDLLKDMGLEQADDTTRNVFELIIKPRQAQSSSVLWQMGDVDKPLVKAGATEVYFGDLIYSGQPCPATNILPPVVTSDYTMNTAPDGSGTNLTASFTVTIENLGNRIKATVTNNSVSDGYVTKLRVWGDAIIALSKVTRTTRDQDSIAQNGELLFRYETDWMQTVNVGETLVTWLKVLMLEANDVASIQMRGRPDIQFKVDLLDGVTASLPTLGLGNANYVVGYIKHKFMNQTGQDVNTVLQLEQIPTLEGAGQFELSDFDAAVFAP
jgi:hypothetical protein